MAIDSYIHTCIIEDGDMAGNKHSEAVDFVDVELETTCAHCGERLATVEEILGHVYRELTENGN